MSVSSVLTTTSYEITGVAHGGEGVCRIEGQVCFVAYALPGDMIRVRVTRQAKRVLWGEIEELVAPSPDRATACCPKFGSCGGCSWLHFAYPAQAEWKRRIVSDCLERIAGVSSEIEWAEDPSLWTGYRTRVRLHAESGRIGFHAQGSHDVVDIEQCPLCHDTVNAALQRLRGLDIRDVIELVTNPLGDDVLVWTQHAQPRLKEVLPQTAWPRSRGERSSFLFDGRPIVNGAFCQASLLLNRLLLKTVEELVGAPTSLLDLYCGNGNLSLSFTNSARVVGIDRSGPAVAAASALGLGGYRAGDEARFTEALRSERWDVVLLDPPRTGAKSIAPALADSDAGAIVYVSCDPATLARDVKTLAGRGWRLVPAVAVDLFPQTAHVETVCRLER